MKCSVEDCPHQEHCRGLCIRHYRRQLHSERSECSVEGCTTKWHSSGLCVKHYTRMRSWGTTDDPEPLPLQGSCSIEECTGAIKARKLCGMHLRRWYKWGSTNLPERAKMRTCNRCRKEFPREESKTTELICSECLPFHRQDRIATRLSRSSEMTEMATRLRERQNGRCAICGTLEENAPRKRLHIDHDYATNVIRALLCGPCNSGLGMFKDSPELLAEAAHYLRKFSRE